MKKKKEKSSCKMISSAAGLVAGSGGWPPLALGGAILLSIFHLSQGCHCPPKSVWEDIFTCRNDVSSDIIVKSRVRRPKFNSQYSPGLNQMLHSLLLSRVASTICQMGIVERA